MQGDELRALRKSAGMTQGELADAIGLTLGFIGEMERGEKDIGRRTEEWVRALCAPLRPIILVGGDWDGHRAWLAEGLKRAQMPVRNAIAPFAAANTITPKRDTVAFREVARDEDSGVTVFAPMGDPDWTDERAMNAARAIGFRE